MQNPKPLHYRGLGIAKLLAWIALVGFHGTNVGAVLQLSMTFDVLYDIRRRRSRRPSTTYGIGAIRRRRRRRPAPAQLGKTGLRSLRVGQV